MLRKIGSSAAAGLWTALALAGSIFLEFYLIIDVLNIPAMSGPVWKQVLTALLAFPAPFIGGALWGGGLALLFGQPVGSWLKRGMTTWGWTMVLGAIVIDFTQIPVFAVVPHLRFIPHITHWLFTLVFVLSVGLIVWWVVRRMLKALANPAADRVAVRWIGVAASAAFLVTSIVLLFGFRWEVAGPFAGRHYNMIRIMEICNFAAALAGGAGLGWVLASVDFGNA